jgi:2-haloacid dehalogenase
MRYTVLLFDADDTIFDFAKTERAALCDMAQALGLPPLTEAEIAAYHACNDACWKALERGELTVPQLKIKRFCDTFATWGRSELDAQAANRIYTDRWGAHHFFFPECLQVLRKLQGKYRLGLITNGFAAVKNRQIQESGLDAFFDGIFVSETVGAPKPSRAYFDFVTRAMGISDPKAVLVIGDSPTADIAGGIACGFDTCYINRKSIPCPAAITPTYEITDLCGLLPLLQVE